jgi:hypothetical protein
MENHRGTRAAPADQRGMTARTAARLGTAD